MRCDTRFPKRNYDDFDGKSPLWKITLDPPSSLKKWVLSHVVPLILVLLTIYLGKIAHDLTVLPKPGIMVYFREIIPFYGLMIQVSEIL